MSKSVFVLVLTVNSCGESIVNWLRLLTPPVPIAISPSQSPLLSVTPVRCMDTANFINVEFQVCYSFSKHNIFSVKARESFVVVWIIEEVRLENWQRICLNHWRGPSWKPATHLSESLKRSVLKTGNAFLQLDFQKLSHFVHKDNAKWRRGSSGSRVLLLFTRFSWDCTEISVYGSSKVYRSWPDVLGLSARSPVRTFSDAAPSKGLRIAHGSLWWVQGLPHGSLWWV